jgi:hypothetical protein
VARWQVFSCHPFLELGHSLIFPRAMERNQKCTAYIFSDQASWRVGKFLVVILFWNWVIA